jgi:predicted MFS family arabinose efflux permease
VSVAIGGSSARSVVARVLLPLCAGFFLSNYYRSVNAILAPYLMAELRLSAGSLGLITSIYFLTSAVFQAPLGLFMDRYGPRKVQGWMMLVATLGTLMFALSSDVGILALGRAIMGIGAAGALMTCFQAVVLWFPRERWPALNGWIMAAGGLGGFFASMPTALALHITDWHGLMLVTAALTGAVALAIFAIVPERRSDTPPPSFAEQIGGLASIYGDRLFWRLAPVAACASGSNLAFGGLWAGPWLKDVGGLGPDGIGLMLLCYSVLVIVGFVVSGNIAAFIVRRGMSLLRFVAILFILSIALQLPLLLPTAAGRWIVIVGVGAFTGITALCFPVLNEHFPPSMSGRVNTAMNLFYFCGAFALQGLVGTIIDFFPQRASGSYPAISYQTAFAAMLTVELLSWLWLLVPGRRRAA